MDVMVCCGMLWYVMVCYCMLSYSMDVMVCCGMIWYVMVVYNMASYDIVCYGMVLYCSYNMVW